MHDGERRRYGVDAIGWVKLVVGMDGLGLSKGVA